MANNINANGIRANIKERMANILLEQPVTSRIQALLVLASVSKEEKAHLFQEAFTDFLAESLPITEENKVVFNDAEYIMEKLNSQFSWEGEKEMFYKECSLCILDAYCDFLSQPIIWQQVPAPATGEYPRFEGNNFISMATQDYADLAPWLYRTFTERVKEQEMSSSVSPKQNTKKKI